MPWFKTGLPAVPTAQQQPLDRGDFTRSRETCLAAAAALMGVVGEVDDIEAAELITRRAMQFEREAAALPAVPADERIRTAVLELAAAIRRHRFDLATGKVGGPDSFYAGVLLAEEIARGWAEL